MTIWKCLLSFSPHFLHLPVPIVPDNFAKLAPFGSFEEQR
jgi:hypothetical protein